MRVAFITSRFPYPVEKGDKLRAFEHIRHLSRTHEVFLFALNHGAVAPDSVDVLRTYCADVKVYKIPNWKVLPNTLVGILSGLPAHVSFFLDPGLKRELQQDVIKVRPDHVFAQLIRTSEYVRSLPYGKTLDYMDTFSYGARQRAATGALFKRPLYALEARRLKHYERSVYPDFDHHTIISEQDRDRLPLAYRKSVHVLANGVDTERFAPQQTARRKDLVFVGNMGYQPNIEAVEFLVRRVMPRVWPDHPDARVHIVGARPHRRVLRLQSGKVEVTGWVEDVRPWYARAGMIVAPMFSGMGQQNKILEAMAMGRPCITTSIVNNAIGAVANEHLLLAENALQFAGQIKHLLHNPERGESMGQAARAFIEQHYTWDHQNKTLETLLYKHREIEHA